MLKRAIKKYQRSGIKKKMIMIIFLFILITSVVFYISIRQIIQFTEKIMYDNSVAMLNVYVAGVESEIEKMDQLSASILTDAKIQEFLVQIKKAVNGLEQFELKKELEAYLAIAGLKKDYIKNAILVDGDVRVSQGIVYGFPPEEEMNALIQSAIVREGAMSITLPSKYSDFLYFTRSIRKIDKYLSLDTLGVILLNVDINEFMSVPARYNQDYVSNIAIVSGRDILYDSSQVLHPDALNDILPRDEDDQEGYLIQNINNTRYFITYSQHNKNNWLYINFVEYAEIYHSIYSMRNLIYTILVVLFVFLLLISVKFVDDITKPITLVIEKMSIVKNGNFKIDEKDFHDENDPREYSQEIEELQNIFVVMIKEINSLITENYEKQILIKESQLKALQAQINPHFLYNTLESINWSAKIEGNRKVSMMVKALGSIFRNSLNTNSSGVITLEEELTLLDYYLTIQGIRFEDRLTVNILVEKSLYKAKIPMLSIQPILENAINYVLETEGAAEVTVKAYREGPLLLVIVQDNGSGMDEHYLDNPSSGNTHTKSTGIGLHNINNRIKITFGNQYGLEIKNSNGATITIRLPYQEME